MVYQDHLIRFGVLKVLKSKTVEIVVYSLVDIFTLLGAPPILHSDNSREFANNVVSSLKEYCLTLNIIHGKPRNLQSQGNIERANEDIENILCTWMQEEKSE